MPTCHECYFARRTDTGDPTKRYCLASRQDSETKVDTAILGKLVNSNDDAEACGLFKKREGKGRDVKRDFEA